ncbi:hypothetical protein ACOSP7_014158 [Xanthoceras sorbifolium]
MPWVDREHHAAAAAESNSSSYRTSARLNTYTHNAVDISTDEEIVSVDTEDEKDEAYNPVDGGWISEASDDSKTYVDSDEVHNEAAEEEGMSVDDGQNAVEDLAHDDPEDTQSEEDIMSDAASYDWDNAFMPDDAVDRNSDGDHGPTGRTKREVSFVQILVDVYG